MVRKTGLRARAAARVIAWLASAGVVVGLGGACTELRGSNGESCLKSQDCLSGLCLQLRCAALPPLLDAAVNAGDAAADATLDGSAADGPAVGSDDATVPPDSSAAETDARDNDAGAVAPGDAAADVVDEGHADAPTDGPTDAPADGRQDGGGPG